MIRVLQCVNNMHRAGLETILMNYYRSMDRTRLQFDFLTHRPEKSDYDDEILALGGRVFYAPRLLPQNYPAYFRYMEQFWRDHPEYQIIHAHIDSMSYLPLLTAKEADVPVRIAHSHNTSIDLDYKYPLKLFFKGKLSTVANYRCACGQEAGNFLFGAEDFTVIPNAIEGDRFLFNAETREKIRTELGISQSEFVVGHVGRLSQQKNHHFLLKIFASVLKQKPTPFCSWLEREKRNTRFGGRPKNWASAAACVFWAAAATWTSCTRLWTCWCCPPCLKASP